MNVNEIIKELRNITRNGSCSDKMIAKRMLNDLYGEPNANDETVRRITLLQFLKTFRCTHGIDIEIKETWYGLPCVTDLGHFEITKDSTLKAYHGKDIFAPDSLLSMYVVDGLTNPLKMCYKVILTHECYFDTDSIKGGTHGNSND